MPSLIWWGRSDPEYSRNRILRALLAEHGWQIRDFHPRLSAFADLEAWLKALPQPDLIWVPCFRQRDMAAALRFARRRGVPLLFDPLISAYDKQVFEQGKIPPGSPRARKLRAWEAQLFQGADLVLADTPEHARFFTEDLGVPGDKTRVVHVGAEEGHFLACPLLPKPQEPRSLQVLFYGSFLHLHGPMTIIEAARRCRDLPIRWQLVGDGALKPQCIAAAKELDQVQFLDWVSYEALPGLICNSDVVLGIFGDTHKASRVIPNKVFQALACGRPVITRASPAYDHDVSEAAYSGLLWVPAANPETLADTVAHLARHPEQLPGLGQAARQTYLRHYARAHISHTLADALAQLGIV